jgi:predicted secreted protein
MKSDWLLRVGDGKNLIRSSKYKIWGINSKTCDGKYFLKEVKPGDRLWFVKSKSHGKLLAVATYSYSKHRELGPHINLTMTNEELGWDNEDTDWVSDMEIHYTNLYNLSHCTHLLSEIKSAKTIRKYNEKCKVQLPQEYENILKYSKPIDEL